MYLRKKERNEHTSKANLLRIDIENRTRKRNCKAQEKNKIARARPLHIMCNFLDT